VLSKAIKFQISTNFESNKTSAWSWIDEIGVKKKNRVKISISKYVQIKFSGKNNFFLGRPPQDVAICQLYKYHYKFKN